MATLFNSVELFLGMLLNRGMLGNGSKLNRTSAN